MKTLTLEQTLHPEWTDDGGSQVLGSPWETFFREARGDIPVAVAEPIEEIDNDNPSPGNVDVVDVEVVLPSKDGPHGFPLTPNGEDEEPRRQRSPGKGCFFVEGLIGGILALTATLAIFALELCGAIVYIIAVGFNYLASEELLMPGLFKAIFYLVVYVLMLVDSVCLFCSVVVSFTTCFEDEQICR